jgi:hypothetical protein
MRNKMNRITVILAAAAFGIAGCGDGAIPVLKTHMDNELAGIRLPAYTPPSPGSASAFMSPRYEKYGTEGTRINPVDLYIKNTYKTSDDVIHIVLSGKIKNGIPEGLLWNTDPAGTLGVPSGTYAGRGDIRVGTLARETGGSMAIGGLDFSAEWVMAGPYTAVVIDGLISDNLATTVIEKNESLNLFSANYRINAPDNPAYYTNTDGKLQRRNVYMYNPNDFMPWPDSGEERWEKKGDPRGGYLMLISKSEKAVPYTASFDIEYSDGTKKRFEVDYSGVELREDIPLTGISFQAMSNSILTGDFPNYYLDVNASSIGNTYNELTPLLRPLYVPENTNNMIKDIYLTDEASRRLNNSGLTLTWDDKTQAIAIYAADPYTLPSPIVIHAVLQKEYEDPIGMSSKELTFIVTIY